MTRIYSGGFSLTTLFYDCAKNKKKTKPLHSTPHTATLLPTTYSKILQMMR